jgi:hypothetical protein
LTQLARSVDRAALEPGDHVPPGETYTDEVMEGCAPS